MNKFNIFNFGSITRVWFVVIKSQCVNVLAKEMRWHNWTAETARKMSEDRGIPHYGESILMLKKELFQGREENVPLMDWCGPWFCMVLCSTHDLLYPGAWGFLRKLLMTMAGSWCWDVLWCLEACRQVRGRVSHFFQSNAGRVWLWNFPRIKYDQIRPHVRRCP